MCCMLMEYQTYACWAWQCKRCCHLILDIKQDLLWGFVADLYCFTEQPSGVRRGKLRQGGEVKWNEAKFYLKFSKKKKFVEVGSRVSFTACKCLRFDYDYNQIIPICQIVMDVQAEPLSLCDCAPIVSYQELTRLLTKSSYITAWKYAL